MSRKILSAIIFMAVASTSLYAQNKGEMRVSLTGAYGLGSENAEMVLDPQFSDTEVKSDFGKAYEIGAGFHYFALDNLSLSFSLSYGQN